MTRSARVGNSEGPRWLRGTVLAVCISHAMDKKTVDGLLAAMVQSEKGISDLLFIDGKAPLLDVYGRLCEFSLDPPGSVLTSDLIQDVADHIIGSNERLLASLAATGSCDCSYE